MKLQKDCLFSFTILQLQGLAKWKIAIAVQTQGRWKSLQLFPSYKFLLCSNNRMVLNRTFQAESIILYLWFYSKKITLWQIEYLGYSSFQNSSIDKKSLSMPVLKFVNIFLKGKNVIAKYQISKTISFHLLSFAKSFGRFLFFLVNMHGKL